MKIATILTVHNRREKTLSCLHSLFTALDTFNSQQQTEQEIEMVVFLTDDGCTDGTADAVKSYFPQRDIRIIQGNGQLFWAGGMRKSWHAAMSSGFSWDYFLLINDDTSIALNVFPQLMEADAFCIETYGRQGICSGITSEFGYPSIITYGGSIFANKTKGRQIMLIPTGTPQMADMTNANILLVPQSIVATIGIFHSGFHHACADYDYSMLARRKGYPVVVTAHVCGECENDHATQKGEIMRLINMSLKERLHYVNTPVHSDRDYLLFVRRNLPLRYPQAFLMRMLRVFCPKLYYHITNARGIYS